MKKTLIVLLLAVVAGSLAHTGWFALRDSGRPQSLEVQLGWMRERLELNAEQYRQIRSIHEQIAPKLAVLATEVGKMREQLAVFEEQRITTGEVDFIAFSKFIEHQRSVDQACADSTRQLVETASAKMTPEQRKQYLSMLAQAFRPADADGVR